jgi:tRNA G18 (ribose-2'-O)-methylase SpoU
VNKTNKTMHTENRKLKNDELGRMSVEAFKNARKMPVVVVLDNVRSALNVGSVFRTSDAFLVEGLCLCGITATPPNPEIHKTALGGEFAVSWKYFPETSGAIDELKAAGYTILSVEQAQSSIKLPDLVLEPGRQYALVFGNEVDGVAQDVIDASHACVEIPQWGSKHSLNIAVSAGIVLWDVIGKIRQES